MKTVDLCSDAPARLHGGPEAADGKLVRFSCDVCVEKEYAGESIVTVAGEPAPA